MGQDTCTLLAVRFVFQNKPQLSALSYVAGTVSVFLDSSVELPLHKACKFQSLPLLDRIWNSKVDVEPGQDSAWSVRNLLRTEAPHYHQYQFSKCLLEAIKLKNLALVEWLFEHFPDTYVRPEVEAAAAAGALDILKYFRANDEEVNSNAQWPHEVEWGAFDAIEAAQKGHWDVVKWLFEEIEESRDEEATFRTMYMAVESGDVKLVRWQLDLGIPLTDGFYSAAAKGAIDMLRTYYTDPANGTGVLLKAAENGQMDIVRWVINRDLEDHGLDSDSDDEGASGSTFHVTSLGGEAGLSIHVAAVNGHLDIAKYLLDCAGAAVGDACSDKEARRRQVTLSKLWSYVGDDHLAQPISNETMRQACEKGLLEVVKWLYSEFGTDRRIDLFKKAQFEDDYFALAMDAAAVNGHLEIVKFLHEMAPVHAAAISSRCKKRKTRWGNVKSAQHPRIKCTASAMNGAAASNNFEMVEWLRANRSEGCTSRALDSAAGLGHIQMMEWLLDHYKVSTSGAMDAAARNGRLDVLKWLHEHTRSTCTNEAMDSAAREGNLEVVKWLHEHTNATCTSDAMDGAAAGGHLDIVKWLHHNRSEGCTSDAMDLAACCGHLDVIKWLHHNDSQGCSARAMLWAAAAGNWDVMKWLHTHRPEDCTSPAIDKAALARDFEAVLFLHRARHERLSAEAARKTEESGFSGLAGWASTNSDELDEDSSSNSDELDEDSSSNSDELDED